MPEQPKISVIFSTYNRSHYLRQTLEAMTQVNRDGVEVEFVVVDNNSTDDTAQVIEAYSNRLPMRHLFEPRPGKNCALNHALDIVELGEIVVFTDDDVVPCTDWLKIIDDACKQWHEYDVFGGKIELIWPEKVQVPKWAKENTIVRQIGFAEHDLGPEVKAYQDGAKPSGPNFWVRGTIFWEGVRYDESIGPRPGQKFGMGSESELLFRLAAAGKKGIYIPSATVGHHVQVCLLNKKNMLKRAIRFGKGNAHSRGIPDPNKLEVIPWRWRMRRFLAMTWYYIQFLLTRFHRDESLRMKMSMDALRYYAYHREALSMSWCMDRVPELSSGDDDHG